MRSCFGSSGGMEVQSGPEVQQRWRLWCSRRSSCRSSLRKSRGKCNDDRLIAPRGRVDMANRSAQESASTRSCFESLLVVPYLPQVIWETGWCRAVLPMPREQLFSPRLPNQGDVPLTGTRRGLVPRTYRWRTDSCSCKIRAETRSQDCRICAQLLTRSRSTSNHCTCTRLTLPCPWVFERGAQSTGCGKAPKLIG